MKERICRVFIFSSCTIAPEMGLSASSVTIPCTVRILLSWFFFFPNWARAALENNIPPASAKARIRNRMDSRPARSNRATKKSPLLLRHRLRLRLRGLPRRRRRFHLHRLRPHRPGTIPTVSCPAPSSRRRTRRSLHFHLRLLLPRRYQYRRRIQGRSTFIWLPQYRYINSGGKRSYALAAAMRRLVVGGTIPLRRISMKSCDR